MSQVPPPQRQKLASTTTVPPVHGRPVPLPHVRTRLSTHQRNLSLDFRSMGIILPPVCQVAPAGPPVTLHHRNRSLDSALQRIPEVDITPSPECEPPLSVPPPHPRPPTSLGSDDSGIICGGYYRYTF